MKKNLTLSLAARNALVYFILFIVAVGFSAWLLISYSYKEVLNITESRLNHTSEMVHVKFESFFKNVETDIDQLAKSPLLNRFVEDPDSINLLLLVTEYKAFLEAKPNYFQVRLINISEYGEELLKIERKGDEIINTPSSQLQNKSDRDYFKELVNLPTGAIYLSKIDLNREFGKISVPHIPTSRMGIKMKSGALNDFIIIININLNALFSELKNTLPQNDELRISNQNGHYIFHPDNSQVFTFDLNKPGFYFKEYEQPLTDIKDQAKGSISETAMNRFMILDYNRKNYQLTTILSAQKIDVLASFYQWRKSVLIASACIAVVFLAIGFLYMRKQVKELKAITKQLTVFSTKLGPQTLPIDRQDEIGELAREFEKMSASISKSHMEIERAKQDAEIAHKEKSEFLENMSHEIRNPLQSILGAIDILNQNEQLTHQKSFLDSIQFSSRQLQSLANDILDFNKIKSLNIKLQPSWASLNNFCLDIYHSSNYLAKSKQIDFQFINQIKNTDIIAFFDTSRLYQIINNLITNALKFTDNKGKVQFIISEKKSGTIKFQVIDNGHGLSSQQKEKILDRHYSEGENAGAGLGIPIVLNLLKIHQSELVIESFENLGSNFSFELKIPLKSEDKPIEVSESINELDHSSNFNILIIEDDPQIIQWYQHILKTCNLKFLTHPSQLQQVAQLKFNHIISDYNFGRTQLDLEAIIPTLKSLLELNGKIIIISGSNLHHSVEGVFVLGKPVNQTQLFNLITEPTLEINPFNKPDFSIVEQDYDYQPELIRNVMALMIKEWEKDQKLINDSITANQILDFEAVHHRLINSIRRLKINHLSDLLNHTKIVFYSTEVNLKRNEINAAFDFYIREMKQFLEDTY